MDQCGPTSDSDPLTFEPGTNVDPVKLECTQDNYRPLLTTKYDNFEVSCPLCADIFWTCQSVVRHILQVHPNNRVTQFKCHICPANYKNAKLVFDHWNLKHKNKSHLVCQACKKQFKLKQYLNKHMKKFHNNTISTPPMLNDLKDKNEDINFHMHFKPDPEADIVPDPLSEFRMDLSESLTIKEEVKTEFEQLHEIDSNEVNLKKEHDIELGCTEFQEENQNMLESETITSRVTKTTNKDITDSNNCEAEVTVDIDLKSEDDPGNSEDLVHNLNAQQQCPYCDIILATNQTLKTHFMAMHVNKTNFECTVCSNKYINLKQLSQHVNVIHIHICKSCGLVFSDLNKLSEHQVLEHNLKLECSKCKVKFMRKQYLQRHIKLKNCRSNPEYSVIRNNIQRSIRFGNMHVKCPIEDCNKVLQKSGLSIHIKALHPEANQFTCKTCSNVTFGNYEVYYNHMINVHLQPPLPCTVSTCNKTFSGTTALKNHIIAIHEKKRDHVCHICGFSSARKNELELHVKRVHENAKPYQCDLCSTKFSSRRNLTNHIKVVHEGIKPFECPECHKKFANKQKLKDHVKVHNDSRDYKCTHCNVGFTVKTSLNVHMKFVHNGVRPFQCSVCEETFLQKTSLEAHIKRNHLNPCN